MEGKAASDITNDLSFLNVHCDEKHGGTVWCDWSDNKGRILRAACEILQGDIILREPPLHCVLEQPSNPAFCKLKALCQTNADVFTNDTLWYWASLCSLRQSQIANRDSRFGWLSDEQQMQMLMLHRHEDLRPSAAVEMLVAEFNLHASVSYIELERLLQVWILNGFEYSSEPLGYILHFLSSLISHSCSPNAIWQHEKDEFVLRARSDIAVNDEITMSYISEDALPMSTKARQNRLPHFTCQCSRCHETHDRSRGFLSRKPGDDAVIVFPAPSPAEGYLDIEGFSEDEVQVLLAEERHLEHMLETCQSGQERDPALLMVLLEKAVVRAEKTLAHHWLLDRGWDLLVDLYCYMRNKKKAQDCMEKRLSFHRHAVPGLSGSTAWVLEAYGDMLIIQTGSSVEPRVIISDSVVANRLWPLVLPLYQESLQILSALFGGEHAYSVSVRRKSLELLQEARRHGVCPPSPCQSPCQSSRSSASSEFEDLSLIDASKQT